MDIKPFFILFSLLFSSASYSGQWHYLESTDIISVQLGGHHSSVGLPAGLYVGLKTSVTGDAANYCSRQDAIVITDEKLADQAYAAILYTLSTG